MLTAVSVGTEYPYLRERKKREEMHTHVRPAAAYGRWLATSCSTSSSSYSCIPPSLLFSSFEQADSLDDKQVNTAPAASAVVIAGSRLRLFLSMLFSSTTLLLLRFAVSKQKLQLFAALERKKYLCLLKNEWRRRLVVKPTKERRHIDTRRLFWLRTNWFLDSKHACSKYVDKRRDWRIRQEEVLIIRYLHILHILVRS